MIKKEEKIEIPEKKKRGTPIVFNDEFHKQWREYCRERYWIRKQKKENEE